MSSKLLGGGILKHKIQLTQLRLENWFLISQYIRLKVKMEKNQQMTGNDQQFNFLFIFERSFASHLLIFLRFSPAYILTCTASNAESTFKSTWHNIVANFSCMDNLHVEEVPTHHRNCNNYQQNQNIATPYSKYSRYSKQD